MTIVRAILTIGKSTIRALPPINFKGAILTITAAVYTIYPILNTMVKPFTTLLARIKSQSPSELQILSVVNVFCVLPEVHVYPYASRLRIAFGNAKLYSRNVLQRSYTIVFPLTMKDSADKNEILKTGM